jgi:N utilization substance protein A
MPTRTCAGCGRKAPQAELFRFVAKDGMLKPGRHEPGRGVYTCRRLACFERAAGHRAFARVLRRPVRVEPTLSALYTPPMTEGAHV